MIIERYNPYLLDAQHCQGVLFPENSLVVHMRIADESSGLQHCLYAIKGSAVCFISMNEALLYSSSRLSRSLQYFNWSCNTSLVSGAVTRQGVEDISHVSVTYSWIGCRSF